MWLKRSSATWPHFGQNANRILATVWPNAMSKMEYIYSKVYLSVVFQLLLTPNERYMCQVRCKLKYGQVRSGQV